MASGFIFPVTVHGLPSDVYGTNITQYANSGGLPSGCGLVVGQFGVLFDRTICRLLKVAGTVNISDAVTPQLGNTNDYTVQQANAANQFVSGVNDRSGIQLIAGHIAWFTTQGIASANVQGGINAGTFLASSNFQGGGFLSNYVAGTANLSTGLVGGQSLQANLELLATTVLSGPAVVRIG